MQEFLRRLDFKIIFYLLLSGITVMFLMPVPEQAGTLVNDKVAHVIIFFVLSLLIDLAYRHYKFIFGLALVLFVYGVLIELLQGWSGYRTFSVFDLVANSLGICAYIVIKKTKLFRID